LDELHADHLHRALRDCDLVHSDVKLSHHAPVNLHGDDLNLVQMDVMKMDDQKLDDQNYLVDLNFHDVRPCAYSLISIKLICFDHTIISQEVFLTK
jgi:hypothetical protein